MGIENPNLNKKHTTETIPLIEDEFDISDGSEEIKEKFDKILNQVDRTIELISEKDYILDNEEVDIIESIFIELDNLDKDIILSQQEHETLQKKTLSLEHALFSKIQNELEKEDLGYKPLPVPLSKSLYFLTHSRDENLADRAKIYLLNNLKSFQKNKVGPEHGYEIVKILNLLSGDRNIVSPENLENIFNTIITNKSLNFGQIVPIISSLYITTIESRGIALRFIKKFLEEYGLPSSDILNAWRNNAKNGESSADKNGEKIKINPEEAEKSLAFIIMKNLFCIKLIEEKEPGVCKFLYHNFGIQNFGRFPAYVWIDQYQKRDSQEPYGLIITAEDDWNSSSYNDETFETYSDLLDRIDKNNSVRIIEARTTPVLAKYLNRIKRKYEHIPQFSIWSGHSNAYDFFLGLSRYRPKNYKYSISDKEFSMLRERNHEDNKFKGVLKKKAPSERIQPYLSLFKGPIILDGCSEDEPDNLPSMVAENTGSTVTYPDGRTSVKDFGFKVDKDGKPSFKVKYNFDVKTVTARG